MLKFELTEQMVAIIGKALGAQPFDAVAPVIAELQNQINAQQTAQQLNGQKPVEVAQAAEAAPQAVN